MAEKVNLDGIELVLSTPDEIPNMEWIGGDIYMTQLLAAWLIVDEHKDIPMNPQILGKPGVGKTTLAYSAAKQLKLPVYIMQCTVDTRPEDLLISPVIGEKNSILYHASPLVSAMIKGGVCILDEANRMAEKSWASLAPLLDQRRYIESIIAGLKIKANPEFRICCTMNEDSSTFEIPEYMHSRLQPQIFIDFPNREEEMKILEFNLPFTRKDLITYTVNFLQQAHNHNKIYTVRDGINICRYYLKLTKFQQSVKNYTKNEKEPQTKLKKKNPPPLNLQLFNQAVKHILGPEAQHFLLDSEEAHDLRKMNNKFRDMFDKLNNVFFEENRENREDRLPLDHDMDDMEFFDDMDDTDLYYMGNQDEEDEDDYPEYTSSTHPDDDKILRIIEEKDEKDDENLPSNDYNPEDINSPKPTEDPNDIIREFFKRREKNRNQQKPNDNFQNNEEDEDDSNSED